MASMMPLQSLLVRVSRSPTPQIGRFSPPSLGRWRRLAPLPASGYPRLVIWAY